MNWAIPEQIARIISLAAVPVVLAIVGWFVQDSLDKRNISQQYVELAVSILTQSEEEVDTDLRGWAVQLLNQNSPTKFSETVASRLKAGQITLPVELTSVLQGGGGVTFSPDQRSIVSGHSDGSIRFWDTQTGMAIGRPLLGHTGPVTNLAFTPDAGLLISSSTDKTAIVWDISTRRVITDP